ncbi:hypothetical protein PX699_13505 [Sphingobium sp. H39-3-25]|uniref:hypothetical protein n=1 Tax=Sphingobium arseniciresistens TaxID=3030834 RepID=UPI0023BA1253|nr:hypothetical protein [Sphingobium arseniciresistens]
MAVVQRARAPEADENPRAVIGGNRAPIDEQVVIDLVEALAAEGLTARIEELIASAGRAPNITSPEIAGRYADLIKQMVAAGKAVEAEREKLNRPLLNAQRALKGRADAIVSPLKDTEAEARAKVNRYDAEQAEIERKRREAAEAERRRLQAIADEEARQERLRLQAIADENARQERLRLQAIEDERAAAEARDAAQIVVEAEEVEVAAPLVEIAVAEPERTSIQGDMGAKVARVTTYKARILSVRQLPDSILKHAKVVEVLQKVIDAQVRGGVREMKGCEIYAETSTAIR